MIKRPSNPHILEQSSKKEDIDLFIQSRNNDKFEIYKFIGYKHHRIAQQICTNRIALYDILSRRSFPADSQRDLMTIKNLFNMNQNWIILGKVEINWEVLHKAVDKLKKSMLGTTLEFQILEYDLQRAHIPHTVKQLMPLILMHKKMDSEIIKQPLPKLNMVAIKILVKQRIAAKKEAKAMQERKEQYKLKANEKKLKIETEKNKQLNPTKIISEREDVVTSRSKETILDFDIMTLRYNNTYR